MPASEADIARLRRMTNEPSETTYSDETLATYLEAWPLVDSKGREIGNANWTEAYDLHAAAADIWEEKAAGFSVKHDFSADGASYSSNQLFEDAMKQANHHRAEQKAKVKLVPPTRVATYFPEFANPVFDEDEPSDWVDTIV